MLFRWLPRSCSRLRIFICYAREDRDLAIGITHALTNDGHDVFIDANSLKVSTDSNEEIRRAIGRADRFVFLASRHSLSPGAYTQTELGFAQKRWPSPKGVVWPVLVDSDIDPAALPPYLRAVQIHVPKGNIVADVAAAIEASRTVRMSCLVAGAAAIVLMGSVASFIAADGLVTASATLVKPQQVVLMPSDKPDDKEGWKTSPVALTVIPINYINDGSRDVRILDETVSLAVGNRTVRMARFNEVDIRPKCSPDWLCIKGSIGPTTVKAHETSPARETMFMPASGEVLDWKELIASACDPTVDAMEISIRAEARSSGPFGTFSRALTTSCRIDLNSLRGWLQERYCGAADGRLPLRLTPQCVG